MLTVTPMPPTRPFEEQQMSKRYFTFGPDHTVWGETMTNRYIVVIAPDNHRELLIAAIGGNGFANEYSQDEFRQYLTRHAVTEFWRIAMIKTCPNCFGPIPNRDFPGEYPGAWSRRGEYEVCSECGHREGLEDLARRWENQK